MLHVAWWAYSALSVAHLPREVAPCQDKQNLSYEHTSDAFNLALLDSRSRASICNNGSAGRRREGGECGREYRRKGSRQAGGGRQAHQESHQAQGNDPHWCWNSWER